MFVNVGHTNTNVIIAKFSNDGFTILKKSNCSIGGENLTIRLYDHINAIIFKKYSINISEYPKKKFIVLKECEKAKKILSANSNAYINIDCLFDDMTINEKIDRKQFEILTNNIILQIVNTVNDCLIDYDINNLDSIELLGGAMRTSKIKELIYNRTKLNIKHTINAEESVSKGCVIFGAIDSPLIKSAEYNINMLLTNKIYMKLSHYKDQIKIIEGNIKLPYSKKITFNLTKNFIMDLYSDDRYYSKYSIKVLNNDDNNKIKIELILEYTLYNEIEIIDYNIKSTDTNIKISITNLHQCLMTEDDISDIKRLNNKLLEEEACIDVFYETINSLEEKYYNSDNIHYDYLRSDEINEIKLLFINVYENIINNDPELDKINDYQKMNNEINHFIQLIQSREKYYNDFNSFNSEIHDKIKKIENYINEENETVAPSNEENEENKDNKDNKENKENKENKASLKEEKEQLKHEIKTDLRLFKEWYDEKFKNSTYEKYEYGNFHKEIQEKFNKVYNKYDSTSI